MFLDIICKSLFGILMTFFRLELEEHVEVNGLPLKEKKNTSKVASVSPVSSPTRKKRVSSRPTPPPPRVEAVSANALKVEWAEKLLSDALKRTVSIDKLMEPGILLQAEVAAQSSDVPETDATDIPTGGPLGSPSNKRSTSLRQRPANPPRDRDEDIQPPYLSATRQASDRPVKAILADEELVEEDDNRSV